MSAARRGRVIAVLSFVLAGGIGIISSTQTWLTVVRADAGEDILVAGADAMALLAPLSLAALALGAALALVGRILRYVFGALGLFFGIVLLLGTGEVLFSLPPSAAESTITEITGLAGSTAIDAVIGSIHATAWPVLALIGWAILVVGSLFVLITAHRWKSGGRRYRSEQGPHVAHDGPVDAVDSWDDLSRGTDPTR